MEREDSMRPTSHRGGTIVALSRPCVPERHAHGGRHREECRWTAASFRARAMAQNVEIAQAKILASLR